MAEEKKRIGNPNIREYAHLGGKATKEKYGPDHYRKMGIKGRETQARQAVEAHDSDTPENSEAL